ASSGACRSRDRSPAARDRRDQSLAREARRAPRNSIDRGRGPERQQRRVAPSTSHVINAQADPSPLSAATFTTFSNEGAGKKWPPAAGPLLPRKKGSRAYAVQRRASF